MNKHKLAANLVVALHIAWTVVLFGGAVLVLFAPWYAPYQIIAIAFTLLISLPFGRVCPLTLFEEWLRKKVNPDYTNHGSYMMTYINKAFSAHFKKRQVATTVGILYTASVAISIATLVFGK